MLLLAQSIQFLFRIWPFCILLSFECLYASWLYACWMDYLFELIIFWMFKIMNHALNWLLRCFRITKWSRNWSKLVGNQLECSWTATRRLAAYSKQLAAWNRRPAVWLLSSCTQVDFRLISINSVTILWSWNISRANLMHDSWF